MFQLLSELYNAPRCRRSPVSRKKQQTVKLCSAADIGSLIFLGNSLSRYPFRCQNRAADLLLLRSRFEFLFVVQLPIVAYAKVIIGQSPLVFRVVVAASQIDPLSKLSSNILERCPTPSGMKASQERSGLTYYVLIGPKVDELRRKSDRNT